MNDDMSDDFALRAAAWADGFSKYLADYVLWYRFDTITGPAIGGAVMVGTLLLAALAAYFGG
ncbi:MAG TPA: hypothetical protein VLT87_10915 [Thermoanaerobaculia bacterium]|nr:hypothetical protein [Thermoanaerobaculia bacterium]